MSPKEEQTVIDTIDGIVPDVIHHPKCGMRYMLQVTHNKCECKCHDLKTPDPNVIIKDEDYSSQEKKTAI